MRVKKCITKVDRNKFVIEFTRSTVTLTTVLIQAATSCISPSRAATRIILSRVGNLETGNESFFAADLPRRTIARGGDQCNSNKKAAPCNAPSS